MSLIPEGSLMRNFIKEPFTIANYTKVFSDSQFFIPFRNSIENVCHCCTHHSDYRRYLFLSDCKEKDP
ncbi:MAG: hypothetical protein IPP52_11525 [Ignavibacteria bacterium]|nr:hypothetical protein [Ignavibacteria bacterium]